LMNYFILKLNDIILDKKFSEILRGSVWALSAKIIATVMGMISTIIIARYYGADVLGIIAVINSFLIFTTIFTILGTNTAILRLIPEHLTKFSPTSAYNIYKKIQVLVTIISLVTGFLFFFFSNIIAEKVFNKPNLSFYFTLASVFIVVNALMQVNINAIRGLKLIRRFAFMQFLPQFLNVSLLLFLGLIYANNNVPIYAMFGSFTMTWIVAWSIIEFAFKKRMNPNDDVVDMSLEEILTISFPMLLAGTMTFITGQTGVILLGIFRTESEVGYYSIAVKLATLTSFVLAAINSIAAPKFSELFHTGEIDELFRVAKKSTKLIFWTTTPILMILLIFGKFFILFLYGKDFTPVYWAMFIIIIGQFVNAISGSTGIFMNMTGHQKVFSNIMIISALFNICFSIILIPKIGIFGAALSGTISLILWNVITLVYMKRKYGLTVSCLPELGL
jgi:O-antigen/teichoic acid export membrane protein